MARHLTSISERHWSPSLSEEAKVPPESKPPLQGKYWVTVAFVLLALVPDLILSTSLETLRPLIASGLHASGQTLGLASTFSNAGWAVGAVVAGDLAQRFRRHILLMLYEGAFVVGSVIAAAAPSIEFVIAGHILQGIATGMLLVGALPPLITNYPVERLNTTAAVVALGLFGAVAAGPLVGGYVAYTDTWRWFFATTALLGSIGFLLVALSVEHAPGFNPALKVDWPAFALAIAGSGLTFYGVGEVSTHAWTAPIVWAPTALGFLSLVVLVIMEYRKSEALMPVKPLSSTFPVIGITAAIISGCAFTGLLELSSLFLQHVRSLDPLAIGLLFWPDFATAVLASLIFGRLLTTRYMLVLPPVGMLALLLAAWLLTTTTTRSGNGEFLWIAGLLGLGAGFTVSPGLFVAALSVPSQLVGRAFALVEMLRLAGAYALVPAFLYFAQVHGTQPGPLVLGLHVVFWVILVLLAVTIIFTTALYVAGGAYLHPPNLTRYLKEGKEAFQSPPVAADVRP